MGVEGERHHKIAQGHRPGFIAIVNVFPGCTVRHENRKRKSLLDHPLSHGFGFACIHHGVPVAKLIAEQVEELAVHIIQPDRVAHTQQQLWRVFACGGPAKAHAYTVHDLVAADNIRVYNIESAVLKNG